MKTRAFLNLFILLLMGFTVSFLSSCEDKVTSERTFTVNVPIYKSAQEVRDAVQTTTMNTAVTELQNPGKIYFKDNYLFVNEVDKGIHVIDNSDPANPRNVAFIAIPGNFDIAISGNVMYADSYVDLVMFDVSDINAIKEVSRMRDIFPTTRYGFDTQYGQAPVDATLGVVVGWKVETITESVDFQPQIWRGGWFSESTMDMAIPNSGSFGNNGSMKQAVGTGVAGSMAKFMLYRNYLYTISEWTLQPFNISDRTNPVAEQLIYVGGGIETLFLNNDRLFIGSRTGMLVYELTNPAQPTYLSSFMHASACDPVVVEGTTAYVTLRAGTVCEGTTNALEVIDIADIKSPKMIRSYQMFGPYGLGIDDGTLFVCDGDAGLKVYDATDPNRITDHLLAHFDDIDAFDVIPLGGVLMLIGADGLFQYDYSDLTNLKLLSRMKVVKD